MKERDLERLRELRSTFNHIGLALRPLENRFPDEGLVLFLLHLVERDCHRRIEEAQEAIA